MKTNFATKTEKELKALLEEKQSSLRAFRFNVAGSNVRNVKEGRMIRKDIARILTAKNATGSVAKSK